MLGLECAGTIQNVCHHPYRLVNLKSVGLCLNIHPHTVNTSYAGLDQVIPSVLK